mgnify:CR=1 FL=1
MATSSFALHLTFIVGMEAADPRCSIESSHTLTLGAFSNMAFLEAITNLYR